MTVKEIIQIENGNRNTIILLREGIFWRAYEKSAYAFFIQVHPYKPTRKWVSFRWAFLYRQPKMY